MLPQDTYMVKVFEMLLTLDTCS